MKARSRAFAVILYILPAIFLIFGFLLFNVPMIRSDGIGYFVWLDSIVQDRNLDLENQFAQYSPINQHQMYRHPITQQIVTPFAFGSAILWALPYILFLRIGALLPLETCFDFLVLRIIPIPNYDCVGPIRSLSVTFSTNLLALATVYLVIDIIRRRMSLATGVVAALSVAFGTPFMYYATIEPTMSHVPGAFVMTLIFWLFHRFEVDKSTHQHPVVWAALGLATGLVTLVRWQLVLVAIPSGFLLLYRKQWISLTVFIICILLLIWPIPAVWYRFYNRFITVPAEHVHREPFLVGPKYILQTWFSARAGLFVWSPVLFLGVLGISKVPKSDYISLLFGSSIFMLQSLVNASTSDWFGGWAFGMRRLTELYPFYVLALAWFLDPLGKALRRSGWTLGIVLCTTLCMWTVFLLISYHRGFIAPDTGTPSDAVRFFIDLYRPMCYSVLGDFRAWVGF
jgi:hypothetical protein